MRIAEIGLLRWMNGKIRKESDDISMKVDEVPTSDKMGRNAGRCFSHVL